MDKFGSTFGKGNAKTGTPPVPGRKASGPAGISGKSGPDKGGSGSEKAKPVQGNSLSPRGGAPSGAAIEKGTSCERATPVSGCSTGGNMHPPASSGPTQGKA